MSFLDIFPIPSFLKMSPYGFDISDESIKYIKFGKNKKTAFIEKYGEKKLPYGIIENGEIKKEKEFLDFLKLNFKDSGIRDIVVSLPEEKAFLDIIELPKTNSADLRGIIGVQLENYFPFKAKDVVFDFEVLNDSGKDILDVLIAAFPKPLIESYKNCLIKAGFLPVVFELEVESLKRALLKKGEDVFKMIVDFGKTRTTFIITEKNSVLFTSTVKIGGFDLDKSLSRSLSLSAEEAENIKKEKGKIFPFGADNAGSPNTEHEIQAVLMPVISNIEQEIKKYIEYWKTHYAHMHKNGYNSDISEIILCGGDANFIGLTEYLSKNLNIPSRLANVWENIFDFENYIPEIEFNESLKYATAAGLALRAEDFN